MNHLRVQLGCAWCTLRKDTVKLHLAEPFNNIRCNCLQALQLFEKGLESLKPIFCLRRLRCRLIRRLYFVSRGQQLGLDVSAYDLIRLRFLDILLRKIVGLELLLVDCTLHYLTHIRSLIVWLGPLLLDSINLTSLLVELDQGLTC